jgi:hypothetical protein
VRICGVYGCRRCVQVLVKQPTIPVSSPRTGIAAAASQVGAAAVRVLGESGIKTKRLAPKKKLSNKRTPTTAGGRRKCTA